jgi:hypothetical protein
MNLSMILLGATESDYTKIAFGVVFVLIWLASMATGALAKREQRKRRELEMSRQRPAPKAPPQRPAARPTPPKLARRPQMPRRPGKLPVQAPPPPVPVAAPVPAEPAYQVTSVPPTRSSRGAAAASVSAPALRAWMRPATLRQQFILTEIFQPPISMREERF